MLQAMAMGGTLGTSLFTNTIVASPYLPTQWDYNGAEPTQAYDLFVQETGCKTPGDNSTVFACLQSADTLVLQNASAYISAGGKYGQWAFLPVTDGDFLRKRPSEQLLAGEVNGLRMLSGVSPHSISSSTNLGNSREDSQTDKQKPEQRKRGSSFRSPKHHQLNFLRLVPTAQLPSPLEQNVITSQTNLRHRTQQLYLRTTLQHPRRQRSNSPQPIRVRHWPATTRKQPVRRNHLRMSQLLARFGLLLPAIIIQERRRSWGPRTWKMGPADEQAKLEIPILRSPLRTRRGPRRLSSDQSRGPRIPHHESRVPDRDATDVGTFHNLRRSDSPFVHHRKHHHFLQRCKDGG